MTEQMLRETLPELSEAAKMLWLAPESLGLGSCVAVPWQVSRGRRVLGGTALSVSSSDCSRHVGCAGCRTDRTGFQSWLE